MSLQGVLERGDEHLSEYPRTASWWNTASKLTCYAAIGYSKLVLSTAYNVEVKGLENLDLALARSQSENRGVVSIMNHMSMVDDPFLWGCLPWSYYRDVDHIRWCLGARNVCFKGTFLSYFFSLGKILPTDRFGRGPFQGSIEAAIRLLSPDDTLGLIYDGSESVKSKWLSYQRDDSAIEIPNLLAKKIQSEYINPVIRSKPSWVHIFPEGFVLQLQPPFNNSMRYFRWGVSRMVLEATRQPIIVPIFSHGFESIAPESEKKTFKERYLPANFGATVKVFIGEPVSDEIIQKYRAEWLALVEKFNRGAKDLNDKLMFDKKVQDLRSRLSSELRRHVLAIREATGEFAPEDVRFKDHQFWRKFTRSEGESHPDVKFVGLNWAIRRLQGLPPLVDEEETTTATEKTKKSWWRW
ncbi:hypothetical protein WICPIJ_000538 [Wickerhamomyces pijperi]|uniref:Tafazzin family protein n=1 Tax=Wickerhamomyces pijperi TaxID=599730 RepID=A0A9P8TRT8_WICPI|nr:hypothetical protein WICPIJ_000538 [Wickerhamomyces pijperi]